MSIVIVFLGHAHFPYVEGSVGVTIFFFLSGYLITTLLRMEHERSGRIQLGEFYLRRTFRILPSLYVTLLAILILDWTGVLGGSVRLSGVLAAAFDAANYVQASGHPNVLPRGSGIFWSVAVEEHFYLLFPLLYVGLLRHLRSRRGQAAVLASLCLVVTVWRTILAVRLHASWQWIHYATDSRADSILLGCLLAVAANPYLDDLHVPQRVATWVLFPLGVAMLVLDDFLMPAELRSPLEFEVQGVGLTLIFTSVVGFPTHGFARLLNLRPVAYLGVLSYGFYLVHRLFQIPLQETFHAGRAATILIAFPLSCLASWVLHIAVELPSGRLRKNISRRMSIPWRLTTEPARSRLTSDA